MRVAVAAALALSLAGCAGWVQPKLKNQPGFGRSGVIRYADGDDYNTRRNKEHEAHRLALQTCRGKFTVVSDRPSRSGRRELTFLCDRHLALKGGSRVAPTLPARVVAEPSTPKFSVVAVFEVQTEAWPEIADRAGGLTQLLRTHVAEQADLHTVPPSAIRGRLLEEKAGSYRACYDEACQIEIGKALAADQSLSTQLVRFGDRCTLTATLYDLETETGASAASVGFPCTTDDLTAAVPVLVSRLRGRGAADASRTADRRPLTP